MDDLRLAVFAEGQEGASWEEWLDLAEAASSGGFETLLQADHRLSTDDRADARGLDPWAAIPALAARVPELRFGTLVSPVGFRQPQELARLASSADLISGGRVELGLGAGWYEQEHRAYGSPFAAARERFERLGEQLAVLRELWSGERSTFSGRFYQLLDAPPLPCHERQPAGPPLIIGANGGPESIRLAARWADEYNVRASDPETVHRVRRALDEAAGACGRDRPPVRLSVLPPRAWFGSGLNRSPAHLREQVQQLHRAGADRIVIHASACGSAGELEALGRELTSRPAQPEEAR